MQPQRHADSVSRTSRHGETRRELRGNVIQWRQQAEVTRHLRQLPLPAAPGEGREPEIIGAKRQSVYISLFVIITLLMVGARLVGLL